MKVEFGFDKRKKAVICKVWDAKGNVARFDGDGLEWLKKQLASNKDGKYEPEVKNEKPKAAAPAAKKAKVTKKRGLLG